MDADELHQKERDAFLDWRRNLSQVESRDNISMTPFEKNLNVWRQLWRVVEMSGNYHTKKPKNENFYSCKTIQHLNVILRQRKKRLRKETTNRQDAEKKKRNCLKQKTKFYLQTKNKFCLKKQVLTNDRCSCSDC
jgi:hypothetical protein